MTWQHLQQLRSTAQAAIRQQLAEKQPIGGRGAIVQSSSIALLPEQRSQPAPAEKPWMAVLYASISYDWHGVDHEGKPWSRNGSYPKNRPYAYRPTWARPDLVMHMYEQKYTQFFELSPNKETGAYHTRRSTIKFEMRAVDNFRPDSYDISYYRMPFKVTLAHWKTNLGEPYEMVSTRTFTIGRGGLTYRPVPDALDNFYEVRVMDISRA